MRSQFKLKAFAKVVLPMILAVVTFFASFARSQSLIPAEHRWKQSLRQSQNTCDSLFTNSKMNPVRIRSALEAYHSVQNLQMQKKPVTEAQESSFSVFHYQYGFSHFEIIELQKGSQYPISKVLLDEPVLTFAISKDENSLYLLRQRLGEFFVDIYHRHSFGTGTNIRPLNWWTSKNQSITFNPRYGSPVKIVAHDDSHLLVVTDLDFTLKISIADGKMKDVHFQK